MPQLSICQRTNQQGFHCKNKLRQGESFCFLHQCHVTRFQCHEISEDGDECRNATLAGSEYCKKHQYIESNLKIEISELIFDLENIVSEYMDVHDYAKLIKLGSGSYSWEKYFKGKIPNIYDAINVYDSVDLVQYIIQKFHIKNIDYSGINFKSVPVAKFTINKIPITGGEYNMLLLGAVEFGNLRVLKYLFTMGYSENLGHSEYYICLGMATNRKYTETIKFLKDKEARYLSSRIK